MNNYICIFLELTEARSRGFCSGFRGLLITILPWASLILPTVISWSLVGNLVITTHHYVSEETVGLPTLG